MLSNVLADLKHLETTRITIKYKDSEFTLKGTLLVVAGDNLGNHQIGGFVENFSSTPYSSSYCLTPLQEFRKDPFYEFMLRTIDNYNENASKAEVQKRLVMGIKLNSILYSLLY